MTKLEELKKEMEDAEEICKAAKLAWRTAEVVAHTATFIYINALREAK